MIILLRAVSLGVVAAAAALLPGKEATPAPAAQDVKIDRVIYDFGNTDEALRWRTVVDGVMGGRSTGQISTTGAGNLLFTGRLSLENNGGFSAIRSAADSNDFSHADGFVVKVRGDGRTYRFDALLRTGRESSGDAYRVGVEQWRVWQEFTTRADEWIEVYLPFESFSKPTFYGTEMPIAPELDPARIARLGFMLYDKQPGPFRLEIASISTYRGQASAAAPEVIAVSDSRLDRLIERLDVPSEEPYTDQPRDVAADRAELNAYLGAAVSRGVPLFNHGQHGACVAVYETALLGVLHLCSSDLLTESEREHVQHVLGASWHDAADRAWALREVIDELLIMSSL